MNKKFLELYNYLYSEGLTTLNKDDFWKQYSGGEKFDNLYSYLSNEGLTELSAQDFQLEYFKGGEDLPIFSVLAPITPTYPGGKKTGAEWIASENKRIKEERQKDGGKSARLSALMEAVGGLENLKLFDEDKQAGLLKTFGLSSEDITSLSEKQERWRNVTEKEDAGGLNYVKDDYRDPYAAEDLGEGLSPQQKEYAFAGWASNYEKSVMNIERDGDKIYQYDDGFWYEILPTKEWLSNPENIDRGSIAGLTGAQKQRITSSAEIEKLNKKYGRDAITEIDPKALAVMQEYMTRDMGSLQRTGYGASGPRYEMVYKSAEEIKRIEEEYERYGDKIKDYDELHKVDGTLVNGVYVVGTVRRNPSTNSWQIKFSQAEKEKMLAANSGDTMNIGKMKAGEWQYGIPELLVNHLNRRHGGNSQSQPTLLNFYDKKDVEDLKNLVEGDYYNGMSEQLKQEYRELSRELNGSNAIVKDPNTGHLILKDQGAFSVLDLLDTQTFLNLEKAYQEGRPMTNILPERYKDFIGAGVNRDQLRNKATKKLYNRLVDHDMSNTRSLDQLKNLFFKNNKIFQISPSEKGRGYYTISVRPEALVYYNPSTPSNLLNTARFNQKTRRGGGGVDEMMDIMLKVDRTPEPITVYLGAYFEDNPSEDKFNPYSKYKLSKYQLGDEDIISGVELRVDETGNQRYYYNMDRDQRAFLTGLATIREYVIDNLDEDAFWDLYDEQLESKKNSLNIGYSSFEKLQKNVLSKKQTLINTWKVTGDDKGYKAFLESKEWKDYKEREKLYKAFETTKLRNLSEELAKTGKLPSVKDGWGYKIQENQTDFTIQTENLKKLNQANEETKKDLQKWKTYLHSLLLDFKFVDPEAYAEGWALMEAGEYMKAGEIFIHGERKMFVKDREKVGPTLREIEMYQNMLDNNNKTMNLKYNSILDNAQDIEYLAGEYYTQREEAAQARAADIGWLEGMAQSFVVGTLDIAYTIGELVDAITPGQSEEEYYADWKLKTMTDEEKERLKIQTGAETTSEMRTYLENDYLRVDKSMFKDVFVKNYSPADISPSDLKNPNIGFFKQAVFGVASSSPGMLASVINPVAGFGVFAAQSYSAIEDEMLSDPDFRFMDKGERFLIAAPYAIGMGIFEEIGVSKIVKATNPAAKSVILKSIQEAIGVTGKDVGVEAFRKTLKQKILQNLTKAGYKMVGGALVEFETGATQSLVLDIGYKNLVNQIKDKESLRKELTGGKFFETPEGAGEIAAQIFKDGLAEAVGGFLMTSVPTITQWMADGEVRLQDPLDAVVIGDATTDVFIRKALITKLKSDILSKKMTEEEAGAVLDAYDKIGSLNKAMPGNLSPEQKLDSLNLLIEKNLLEKEIEGKDESLVAAQKQRIKEIDVELKKISEDAFQKQTTSETTTEEAKKVEAQKADIERRKEEKENSFNKAGKESKNKGDGKILGQWILDNAVLGDTITDEDGNGYEITHIDRNGNVELTAFEINEKGEKEYLQTADGIRLISKNQLKQGDLFEYSYTDLDGNKVIKQYKYNAKYDAELAALEEAKPEVVTEEGVKEETVEKESKVTPTGPEVEVKGRAKKARVIQETQIEYDELTKAIERGKAYREMVEGSGYTEADFNRLSDRRKKQIARKSGKVNPNELEAAANDEASLKRNQNRLNTLNEERSSGITLEDIPVVEQGKRVPDGYERVKGTNYIVPREVYEEAYKNDTANNRKGGQSLDRIIGRGGYGVSEFNALLPNWKQRVVEINQGEIETEATPTVTETIKEEVVKEPVSPTKNLVTKENVEELRAKQTTREGQKVMTAAKMVLNALPDVKIYVHETTAEYENAIKQKSEEGDKGAFVPSKNEIHVNLQNGGNVVTLFHESMHSALQSKGMQTGAILDMAKGLQSIISDKDLKARLSEFISQYDVNEQAEEYLAELGAIMSEAKQELTTTKFQRFKALLGRIFKKLGLPARMVPFANAMNAVDAASFMNNLTKQLRTGEQVVSKEEVINVNTEELSIKKRKVGAFEVSYFEDESRFFDLVKQGLVESNYDIANISGQVVAVHQPDNMFVGNLNYKGENIFRGNGGVFYTTDTGNVWASGKESSAKQLSNLINRSLKESTDGVGRLVLVRGVDSKMISSVEGVKASMSIIELMVDKGLISRSDFRSSLIRVGKKFNIDFSGKDSSAAIHKDIKDKFMDVENSTFERRGDFFNQVIDDLGKTSKSVQENIKGIREFLGSERKISFSVEGVRDSIGNILTERLLLGLPKSHVYAVIEVTEPVTYEKQEGNESYPWVLKSESKPKLKLLSERPNAVKGNVFEMTDGSAPTYGKLGLSQRGMGIARVAQQEQTTEKLRKQKAPSIKRQKGEKLTQPVAGNKLFNEPLKEAEDIAKTYMKSAGMEYIPVEKITQLDKDLSKRIATAYDQMENNPNDPKVKAAYDALMKETIAQYDAIIDAGYQIEINNTEPYSNSQELISDLKDNKRMRMYSTEAGFGDTPITDKQRSESILLQDSGKTDINGEKLLNNDIFRFVHDFFGHAKLGNSFGPIGEENAWRVHAVMYSPEARKALTSETRGQNSWVNFSGVNDEVFKKRDKARELRKQGKVEEANRLVDEVYEDMKFAEQKIGLLPDFATEERAPSIKKQKSPKQKWTETPVKNMSESPIAKNSDKVRNAAISLIKGLINVEDYRDIVNKFSPIKSIGTLFAPASTEHMKLALGKKADKLMAPAVDENGNKLKKVGTRLDIPSYLHNNAWVVTVHDERIKKGPVVSYRNAVRLKNVEFSTDPRIALQIAAGYKGKSTFARMVGEMVDIPGATAEEQGLNAQLLVEDIMNDPNWVQVGMNPFRHSFFWNRATGMPVVSADEVIQIGGLVYAKNAKEASPNSEEFAVYGELDESGKKPSIKASDKPLLDKSGKIIKFQKSQSPRQQAIQKAKDKYELSVEKRGNSHDQGVSAALGDLKKSDWYKNADDTAREDAVREIEEFFGAKLKKAPSAKKITGAPKRTKVTVDEAAALKDQIRLEAKAARDAKKDLNQKRKQIAATVKAMVKAGKITQKQAASIIAQANSINLDNEQNVQRFLDYTEKVFKDSNYREKLQQANSKRKSIRKKSKSKNQAEVVGMAKQFANIEPSMVEDIDEYLEVAEKVDNAVKPSRQKGVGYIYKEAASIGEVNKYSAEQLEIQQKLKEENNKQRLLNKYSELVEDGTLKKEMSVKEILQTIESLKDPNQDLKNTEEVKKVVLEKLNEMVQELKDFVLKEKTNPITGEELELNDKETAIFRDIAKMDLAELDVRSLVYLTEALENYFVNGITSGLEANVRSYVGAINAKNFAENKTKAKSFRNMLGRFSADNIVALPLIIERSFRGQTIGSAFMNDSGLTEVINGSSKSNKDYNQIITEYSKQSFYKSKGFMDKKNMYERGMLAFIMRTVSGSMEEMNAETSRRIMAIQESIKNLLESGDKNLVEMGEVYQDVADKLNIESNDIDVIMANASRSNEDAVNWWVSKWQEHYSDLYDINLSVYNNQLSSDINYTPDKIRVADINYEDVTNDSSFMSSLGYVDTKKTGVLMENQRTLPTNGYVDFSFEINNANSIKSALVDINTAGAIRQLKGFLDSKAYKSIIPDMKTRQLITNRITDYVKAVKGKTIPTRNSLKEMEKILNTAAKYGSVKALGGILSAPKQLTPIINTLINTAGRTGLRHVFSAWGWISDLGMPISNRGIEANVNITKIDKKISQTLGPAGQVGDFLDSAGQLWLDLSIKYPDLLAARASFIAYYLKALKRIDPNINISEIDWSTHEVNQEAANYAQQQVDRQQNVSDPLLMGRAWSDPGSGWKFFTKVVIPFTSFIYNTRGKSTNDLLIATSPIASAEDRAAATRSLVSLPVEIGAFAGLGILGRYITKQIGDALFGDDDDDEEKDEVIFETPFGKMTREDLYLYSPAISNFATDLLSPLPGITDEYTIQFLNKYIFEKRPLISQGTLNEMVKEENEERLMSGMEPMTSEEEMKFIKKLKEERTFKLYEPKHSSDILSAISGLGSIGIFAKEYEKFTQILEAYNTGKITYTDQYGNEKVKYLKEKDKEDLIWALGLEGLYMLNLLPREASSIAKQEYNKSKRNAITESQYKKEKELKDILKRNPNELEDVLFEKGLSPEKIQEESMIITERFELNSDQIKEYIKVRPKLRGEDTKYYVAKLIKDGLTGEQALKKTHDLFKKAYNIK